MRIHIVHAFWKIISLYLFRYTQIIDSVPLFSSFPSAIPIKCLSYPLIISSSVISIFLSLCTLVWEFFFFCLFFICILNLFSQSNLIFSCLFCSWFILGTSDERELSHSHRVQNLPLFCFIFVCLFVYLCLHFWHMEVGRLGVR